MIRVFSWLAVASIVLVPGMLHAQEQGKGGNNKAAAGNDAPQYWLGVAVENVPLSFTRHVKGLVPGQGLMVVGVLPQTPAEKAGLKAEDLLIELNGSVLKTQEQMARVVNTVDAKAATPLECDVVYLRDGDRHAVKLLPQLRPQNMLVLGGNIQNFVVQGPAGNVGGNAKSSDMQNLVLPNGQGVQVGPGYQFSLNNNESSTVIVREALKDGTVVMTQEPDAQGNLKRSISAGGKTYALPEDMDKVPPTLRALAQDFQNNGANSKNVRGNNNREQQQMQFNNSNFGNTGNYGNAVDNNLNRQDDVSRNIQQLREENKSLQEEVRNMRQLLEKLAPATK